uniref:Membrane spanning 4-domains A13 n=1 Tax=Balaenoptera musculus TaxID=9771 RepID=A0A8C0CQW8_BALMU
MIGIFSVFMWYLLLILYIGQIKGVFGTYEPITYKTGCSLWGIIKFGREISRVLLGFYPLELCIAFTYTIFGYVGLCCKNEDDHTTVTEEAESAF